MGVLEGFGEGARGTGSWGGGGRSKEGGVVEGGARI